MSLISYTTIDETFPIAGQDNNSQGFRDNFSYIKSALLVAKNEITTLEDNTAKTNDDNDFDGNTLQNAEYKLLYGSLSAQGNIPTAPGTGAANCDVRNAVYFTYTVTENLVLTFTNWPASGKEYRVRIDFKSDGVARTINFATSGGGSIKKTFSVPFSLSATASTNSIFEAWTINGGSVVFVRHLGNYA